MKESVTGLILAGGRATRMGGSDKGLLEIAGRPLVRRIADQLATQVDSILINANRNRLDYEQLGYPVIADQRDDFQGPLAGMLSGLRSATTDWVLTAPCDGPYLDHHYASTMLEAAVHQQVRLCVAADSNRLQPVYCLIHHSLADSIEQFLNSGERKIDRWFSAHQHAIVEFDGEPSMFTNVNTPAELVQVEQAVATDG